MFWSVNIGSIAGTAVRIHITFLMFLVWIFAAGWASGRTAGRHEQPGVRGSAVRLRARPRVRPHLHGTRVRRRNARRDAAADRRRRPARAHPGKAERGIPDRDRRPAGQHRDRARADGVHAGALRHAESRRGGEHERLAGRPAGGGQPVPRAVQPHPGVPDGRRAGAARAARDQARLCPRDRGRGDHRPVVRLRPRLPRPVLQSAADLHRDLRLSRRRLRSAARRVAGDVARRSRERRDDDGVRDAHPRRAHRRRGADAAAHEPGRVSGDRRRAPARRPARPRRDHPGAQGARSRRQGQRGDGEGDPDDRDPPPPRRGVPPACRRRARPRSASSTPRAASPASSPPRPSARCCS